MIESINILFKIPVAGFYSPAFGRIMSQSFHRHTVRQHYKALLLGILLLLTFFASPAQQIVIKFHHTANGKPLVLQDSSYTNPFGELYQLTRLKYYISHIGLAKKPESRVELIEAGATDSIIMNPKAGNYSKLYFTLGVDSALNNSGAQAGALDPLNGMFWTWNSGYIFFKMEGYSTASAADLNRIEHHVGGYLYPNNVAKNMVLDLPQPMHVKPADKKTIHVEMNLDHYWKGINDIKIAEQALLMTPGGLALKAAENFTAMFSIKSIE